MNKESVFTFLLAIAAAVALVYSIGGFDKPKPAVYVPTITTETTPIEIATPTTPEVTPLSSADAPTTQVTTPVVTPAPAPSKALTAAEVARHSTKSDCWMIISGNVYNFSSYIPQHPGGQSVIINECGQDGTRTFVEERKHARSNVQAELAYYLLGALE